MDRPGDPDAEPKPTPKPAARLNTRAPLEMAAVFGSPGATIAFIFTNEGAASTSLAPLGSVGNGFTIVTPTNGIVRQSLKPADAEGAVSVGVGRQKVWKADITAFFKARKLAAPGWYQLFWKLGERKAGPLWLYKAPPQAPATTPAPAAR